MSRSILDRHIAKAVLSAIGLVTLMLAGLQVFILFVSQLDDLGKMDYKILQATYFVLLQLPYQMYLFFPMASLLGALIGLGVMANHSELIIMRAAGMSITQITGSVLKAAIVLIIAVSIMGETLVPWMSHDANDYKTVALSGGQTLRTAQGLWLRYGHDFIAIDSIAPNDVLHDVIQFRFDEQHHLTLARNIKEARYNQTEHLWVASDVKQTKFYPTHTTACYFDTLAWDVKVKPQLLRINGINPDEMSLYELYRYVHEQKKHYYHNIHNYQFAFWQRIIQPLTSVVMMMLAIPFIFGPLRSSTMGSKLLVGATVGFGFHILNRFFGPVSAVFQWPPEWAALGPTVIFAVIGVVLMKGVR